MNNRRLPIIILSIVGFIVFLTLSSSLWFTIEATERARGYFKGYGPSSPSIGILKDGELVYMMERYQIEGRGPEQIANELTQAFDKLCAPATMAAG